MTELAGILTSAMYRVSIKALIRNEKGEILCVKLASGDGIDAQPKWDLPGGGIEHGESVHETLARELNEEACITEPFQFRPIGLESQFSEAHQLWWMGIVHEVVFDNEFDFRPGKETADVQFVDPAELANSGYDTEQFIYKWSQAQIPNTPHHTEMIRGVMGDDTSGPVQYAASIYRVSLKAIIRNASGDVLVVKEHDDNWIIPGGGIDHGETDDEALARELFEEASITAQFKGMILGVDSIYSVRRQGWLLLVVYDVVIRGDYEYGPGEDASAAEFIDVKDFKDSTNRGEQLVYKWATIATNK